MKLILMQMKKEVGHVFLLLQIMLLTSQFKRIILTINLSIMKNVMIYVLISGVKDLPENSTQLAVSQTK